MRIRKPLKPKPLPPPPEPTPTPAPTPTPTPPAPPAPVVSSVGAARIDGATVLSEAAKNNALILFDFADTFPSPHTARYKAIYKNATSISNVGDYGVTYAQARTAGDWILRDASGNELKWDGRADVFLPDMANVGYQQAWAENVYAALQAAGVNAVQADNATLHSYHEVIAGDAYRNGAVVTVRDWQTATISFWRYVGEYLRSRGKKIAGLASVSSDDRATLAKAWWPQLVFDQAGPFMPGQGLFDWFMVEFYMRVAFPGDPGVRLDSPDAWYWNWSDWRTLPDTAHAIGSGFMGFDWGSETSGRPGTSELAADDAACRYGYASLLLNYDPRFADCHVFSTRVVDQSTVGGHAILLGAPLAPAVQQANGTWTREFSMGRVIVNPTRATQTTGGHVLASGTAYIGA